MIGQGLCLQDVQQRGEPMKLTEFQDFPILYFREIPKKPMISRMLAKFADIASDSPTSIQSHDCNICIHGLGG